MDRSSVQKTQKKPACISQLQRQSARSPSAAHPLSELQRSIGNQAVQRLINSPYIQTKLQISTPGDPYEQEADSVADTVMRMPDPKATAVEPMRIQAKPQATQISGLLPEEEEEEVQTKSLSSQLSRSLRIHSVHRSASAAIQRLCTGCEDEKQQDQGQSGGMVHRKSAPEQPLDDDVEEKQVQLTGAQTATPNITTSVAANIHAMNGGGSPLSNRSRAFFEPRFGADFSHVRVHTDSRATQTASSINARAFTVGHNIAFGTGQYTPDSREGMQVLAHELTHVVQQSGVVRDFQNTRNRDLSVQKRIMESDAVHHVPLTVQRATREELLTAYKDALSRSDWNDVAIRLNSFNDADITRLISTYKRATLLAVKDAALEVMPGWNARVVRPINARLAALMGPDMSLYASAKEIKDYLLNSPFLKSYISSKFAGGNPLEGHIHVPDDAAFRTACIAYIMSTGKNREEAEAAEPGVGAFRHGDEIYVRESDGKFATTLHESMHLFASLAYRKHLSNNANEGAAEYFTRIICKEQGLPRTGVYESQFKSTTLLVGATSKEAVADAYFSGDVLALATAVDTAKGAGTLKRWSEFMNTGSYGKADALLK